ncbi:MAG TPA: hypothetical protein VFJ83_00700 [Nocardioidaceae bacterium]|nr:hypothetical protein [Nocardioidaceae bacterium]
MDENDDDLARQAELFSEVVDPYVKAALVAEDPWDAYDAVVSLRGALVDELDWLPNGGDVFVAWAELEDLYETGRTPIPDAHAALRKAATEWLAMPQVPDATHVESWLDATAKAVEFLFRRDGTFWRSPE